MSYRNKMSYKELYTRYQDTVADVEAGVLHEDYIDTAVYAVVDAYCEQHNLDFDDVDFLEIFCDIAIDEEETA